MSNISFFNPQFLFALLFILAIILIHFLRRPRTVYLNFSTLRFFTQDAVFQKKTRKLRKILQMLVRCAIVVVIILLFARPFNPSEPMNRLHFPQTPIYVWIDPTLSMDYLDGSKSIGELSCSIIDSLQKLIPNNKLYLFDHDSKTFLLKVQPTPFVSSYLPSDLEDALNEIQNISIDTDPLFIVLSDFQVPLKSVLEKRVSDLDKRITVVCVPVNPKKPWNYSIADAQIANYNDLTVSAFVKTQGKSIRNGELVAESGRMRIGRASVKLSENEKKKVHINGRLLSGNSAGKLILSSKDPLLFDNSAYFTMESSTPNRVIIVGDKTRCKPIAFALSASSKGLWGPVKVKESSEVTFDDLDSADLVIINELVSPVNALNAFLNDPAQNKKAIVFCCSVDNIASAGVFLNNMLISAVNYIVQEYKTPLSPILPDTTSVIWQHFPSVRSEDVLVYKRGGGIEGEVLLRLSDGSPLLIKASDKKGRSWLILTTPLGVTDANNLSESGFFVPLVDRICRYLMHYNKLPGESIIAGRTYKNPYFSSGSDVTIFDENSKLIKTINNSQPFFHYEKPGIYKIVPLGQPSFFLAVQADPSESVLEYALPDADRYTNLLIKSKEKFFGSVTSKGQMVLNIILWILLSALLLAETLLWDRQNRKNHVQVKE